MQPRVKLTLVGLAVLVLIGLPAATHYRAKGRLHAYRLGLKTSGDLISLEALRPVFTQDEQENGSELMAAAGLFSPIYSNAPMMRLLAPGRALAACREEVLPTSDSTNIWPGLAALFKLNEGTVEDVRSILARGGFGIALQYSQGPTMALPHLSRMKALTQWLSLGATVKLHAGDVSGASEDLTALSSLVAGSGKEYTLISELVRVAMAAIAINTTWEGLQCPGWKDEQLQGLQTRWQSVDLLTQAEFALQMERLFGEKSFADGRESYSAANLMGGSGTSGLSELAEIGKQIIDNPGEGFRTALRRYPGYWSWKWWQSYDDEIANDESSQAAINAVRQAKSAGNLRRLVKEFEQSRAGIKARHPSANKWLDYSAADTLDRFLVRIRTVEIERSLLIAAIALKRYELKQGQYPDTLDVLSPAFTAEPPRDPMDGQPLRYRRETEGGFWLYSIGENGTDDGGNPELLAEARKQWWRARDAVWPQPATREQVQAEFRQAAEQRQKLQAESKMPKSALEQQFLKRYGLFAPSPSTTNAATNQ